MKSILSLGIIFFALSFCGLTDKFKGLSSDSNTANSNSSTSNSAPTSTTTEKAKPTGSPQAIIDAGTEVKWDEQGVSWKLPSGWKKMSVAKDSFNYQSPDNAFLLVSVSTLQTIFRWM